MAQRLKDQREGAGKEWKEGTGQVNDGHHRGREREVWVFERRNGERKRG